MSSSAALELEIKARPDGGDRFERAHQIASELYFEDLDRFFEEFIFSYEKGGSE
ncbi:MAG: hypothetical protein AB1405_03630 [Bdellovibrionota bacterium]